MKARAEQIKQDGDDGGIFAWWWEQQPRNPPTDLVDRVRCGKLRLPSEGLAFSRRLIWDWIQAQQIPIRTIR
jgi:hypothetical protein